MRRISVFLACLISGIGAAQAGQLNFDFSSLDSTYWEILNSDGNWSVWADGQLHITHPPSTDPANRVGGIVSRFALYGNFEMTVEYSFTTLPVPDSQDHIGNQQKLHVVWNPELGFLAERSRLVNGPGGYNDVEDTYAHWSGGGTSPGYWIQSGATTGQLRLTRNGSVLTGYRRSSSSDSWHPIGSYDFGSDLSADTPIQVVLEGFNNWSDDPIDVTFDNLSIQADRISIVPEPSSFGLALGAMLGVSLWRWWRRRSLP